MKKVILLSALLYYVQIQAQITNITGPAGSGQFGKTVTVLTNGNYVVTDPSYDEGNIVNVGAVYLYNGATHTVISTLKGSKTSDSAGSDGVIPLSNSNYIINSRYWDNGAVADAGAVTWGNGATGISGVISSGNSLVGSQTNDAIWNTVEKIGNGNYVVLCPYWDNGAVANAGAATWGNGTTGISGVISSSNSLVGGTADDRVGNSGITVLANSNFVVISADWDNGSTIDAGAVTWCNGSAGNSGFIGSGNSLVGVNANDLIGNNGVTALSNRNYVINSPNWSNGTAVEAGAATWADGTTGISGFISSSNSLIGGKANDQISGNGTTALENGNYVVISTEWDNGAVSNAGAATWGNGTTGITGIVSSSNSLVGSLTNDNVGNSVTALTNDNYVVISTNWNNGAGATTWGNGTTGITGIVSSSNSLVGSLTGDNAGSGVTALTNGNYVVISTNWNNGAGAITWGNGTTGITGIISSSNSLTGSKPYDAVGSGGITALTNGNYVIGSPSWDNGSVSDAGAATWCNGTTGTTGYVNSGNSLVGSTINNNVGFNGIIALKNGNYVVNSSRWDNGVETNAGAVTWGNGASGIAGIVSSNNSLVGRTAGDFVGADNVGTNGIIALNNGNYLVNSPQFNNTAGTNAHGAVTWGNGVTGITGYVSIYNSLTGGNYGDFIGYGGVTVFTNNDFVVRSIFMPYGSGTYTAVVTFGSGTSGVASNAIAIIASGCNSITGIIPGAPAYLSLPDFAYNSPYNYLITGRPYENTVSFFNPTGMSLAITGDSKTANINGLTSTPLIVNTETIVNSNCRLIATITPNGSNPVTDIVNAKVWIENAVLADENGDDPYVTRHYQITPAVNASAATAKITLYFTQQEFDAFNAHPGSVLNLPTGAGEITAIGNIRIGKYPGVSNNGTGIPFTYPGPPQIIDPDDSDIVWNNNLSRWEISFDLTGFSGFILQTKPTALLPLKLLSFSASLLQKDVVLNWKTTNEINTKIFEVERSTDGRNFITVGTVTAINNAGDHIYNYTDAGAALLNAGKLYYRLKQIDNDGRYNYSSIAVLHFVANNSITVYPNPVNNTAKVSFGNTTLLNTKAALFDMHGKKIMQLTVKTNPLQIDMSHLPGGVFILKLKDGTALKIIKN